MNLLDKLNKNTIIYPLASTCKQDVMHELLDHLLKLNYLTSTVKLFEYIDNKDKQFNSASGRGIAYHYNTSIEIPETTAVLGISKQGIDYGANDGLLCHFILLIIEPEHEENKHRILINLFQNMIKDSSIRKQLLNGSSLVELENIIKHWEEDQNTIDDIL